MFNKILIANRGEIACRIIRTARKLGIKTVAIHSDIDARSQHVLMADETVSLGGKTPAESYLRIDAVIEAAQATGAEAIHPGYGFLSENPDFVDALDRSGLIFIGPSAKAIRSMGLKDAAKALMERAGVPVVPGYHGEDQSLETLAAEAKKIGFPVLIKAVAGGGGKGMRLVEQASEFTSALDAARGEAEAAFGNADVLVEKYVSKPRHIEVQVFGDGARSVHLFERDCSLQRRHQKVIEEAPAPGMTDEMRGAMCDAAVRAAEAIGYSGAGTIEFIVDASEGLRPDLFWFMEMNTRLQVEHPVTEAITGVDLVEWQLRVASGDTLDTIAPDLKILGHSMEARLYAEDVPKGFLPATGRVSHISFPQVARADSGVVSGDDISPYYDPMIAKLVVQAPTRDQAVRELQDALAATQISGTVTNLAFLGALARHKGFVSGDVDTGLIARDHAQLVDVPDASAEELISAGMAVSGLQRTAPLAGFSLWGALRQRVTLGRDGEEVELFAHVHGPDKQVWEVKAQEIHATRIRDIWYANGRALPDVHVDDNTVTVFGSVPQVFDRIDPLAGSGQDAADQDVVEAPMPGLVKAVFVEANAEVRQGDQLVILEAMKMEHALTAPRDGSVAEVLAAEGAQVSAGMPLVRLHDPEDAS